MVKSFREFFGLSQAYLADYLRITRSQLSMVEIGQRDLPAEKLLALLKFYKIVGEKPAGVDAENTVDSPMAEERQTLIDQLLTIYQWKLDKAQKQLDKLNLTLARSKTILAQMDKLRSVATPKDENLIEIINYEAQKRKKAAAQANLKLELQICSLRAQIKYLETQQLKADDSNFASPLT
jgi:transcriptional regulator with XRE-family HTH domain